ncbi:N-acetyltransferase [cyanobacterium endosymbiont of Rhopalodia gibberula]|uniref:GNAT family N-acetyltransferase n=1 Tax=cyanobacterium endosymbiont of Rhopalodia gibberula TaxID=1763363 RepID=UPI000DC6FB6F|nr:GNAT family N-acetyltransferase [cyanobacterium endosymbiont of Rhopalodia gibberula]BBA79228.1 N-acetyltransferase [cyanobacterium endosymbiont of Rhopalodia gibberula]
MNSSLDDAPNPIIRSVQYRDLDPIEHLIVQIAQEQPGLNLVGFIQQLQQARRWFGLLKFLSWFPNLFQHHFCVFIAEPKTLLNQGTERLQGFIQISPFNRGRSTWCVEQVVINNQDSQPQLMTDSKGVGSQLLRHCFETIWEARTWVLEVNISQKSTLALYRQNGFQPLAQLTYWSLAPKLLQELAPGDSDFPNLLPVSNADAHLLYQLDCVSMPPLLRQVFDRHLPDFKTPFLAGLVSKFQQWCDHTDVAQGYVFEPQRKAAVGYFKLILCTNGSSPHQAQLTVHPAYTWLYPKLFTKMAQIVQNFPSQSLELVSTDYQHEREEYLEKLGAQRNQHTLLMSRSVWHKLKEAKPEGLHLSEMLQGLQAVPRTPIPSRISWFKISFNSSEKKPNSRKEKQSRHKPQILGKSSEFNDEP